MIDINKKYRTKAGDELIRLLYKGVADLDEQQDAADRIEQLAATCEELEAKLAKAVEAERERCAKVAESVALPMDGRNAKAQADYMSKVIASAIRAELKGQDDE